MSEQLKPGPSPSLASLLSSTELARQLRSVAELEPFYSSPIIAAADRLDALATITRADALFIEWVGHYGQSPGWMTVETADKLLTLASKIAVLVPPETPRNVSRDTSRKRLDVNAL